MDHPHSLYLGILTLLVSCSLMASAYDPPNDSVVWDAFHHWKHEHGKIYGAAEDQTRFATFKANFHFIHSSNEALPHLKLAINQFADQSPAEFRQLNCGYKADQNN